MPRRTPGMPDEVVTLLAAICIYAAGRMSGTTISGAFEAANSFTAEAKKLLPEVFEDNDDAPGG